MKRNPANTLAASALVLMCLCYVNGCFLLHPASTQPITPLQKVIDARHTYSATIRTLTAARQLGQISDKNAVKIDVISDEVLASINMMEYQARTGQPGDFDAAERVYNVLIDRLIAYKAGVH